MCHKVGIDTGYNIIHHHIDATSSFSLKVRRRKWLRDIEQTKENERQNDKRQVTFVDRTNKGDPLTNDFIAHHAAWVCLICASHNYICGLYPAIIRASEAAMRMRFCWRSGKK